VYARISTYSGDMSTFLQHFERGAAALEGWNGLDHVHIMVNEQTGRAVALSVWADEESMRAGDAGADEMRTRVFGAVRRQDGFGGALPARADGAGAGQQGDAAAHRDGPLISGAAAAVEPGGIRTEARALARRRAAP
jgi:hypothetical protein